MAAMREHADRSCIHELSRLTGHPAVARAEELIRSSDERTLLDQVGLTRIPAPPFAEGERAGRMAEELRAAGLDEVGLDEAGNVVASYPVGDGPPLVLAAHLDTIFPAEVEVVVRRDGDRLEGPGISDDGRGLAALLALARALVGAEVPTCAPVLFVATVGEEGAGDLRGVKHLFREDGGAGARCFVSLDGAGLERLVVRGLGSRRLRATVRGPGGHSWTDWGTANPIHALGTAVAELERMSLPTTPATTVTVARWGGGTSINSIPREAWVELDLRSESSGVLAETEEAVRRHLGGAVATVTSRASRTSEPLRMEIRVIGDRPPGETPEESEVVQAAVAATRLLELEPSLVASSTDANVPMALGIPALAMGAGGRAGQAHTPDEWYENERGPDGIVRALHTVVQTVGVEPA